MTTNIESFKLNTNWHVTNFTINTYSPVTNDEISAIVSYATQQEERLDSMEKKLNRRIENTQFWGFFGLVAVLLISAFMADCVYQWNRIEIKK